LPLPRDVGLVKDDFQKSTIYNRHQSLVNYILNILLMKPGNLPTMPELGVNITKYIKNNMSEILDPAQLQGLIASNCKDMLPFIDESRIFVANDIIHNGRSYLIISIPLMEEVEEQSTITAYYAFYRDELNKLHFNFQIEES
jgi:hypothetical protein